MQYATSPAPIPSLVLEVVSFMSCCRDLHVHVQSSKAKIPDFLIKGQLDADALSLDKPMTGELTVKHCSIEIKSIELQLVRVETTAYAEGEVREGITREVLATGSHFLSWSRFCPILVYPATEIQNIQLVDGNICSDLVIPIYMVFPRLFTCSSLATRNFKVEFEANLVVQFADGHMVCHVIMGAHQFSHEYDKLAGHTPVLFGFFVSQVTENFPIKLIR